MTRSILIDSATSSVVTGNVDEAYLDHLEYIRSDNMVTEDGGLASAQLALAAAVAVKNVVRLCIWYEQRWWWLGQHTSPTRWPAVGVDMIGLYNAWKLNCLLRYRAPGEVLDASMP